MLTIKDLQNLIILSREGMSIVSTKINSDQAKVAWESIANAEKIVFEHFENMKKEENKDNQK